MPHTVFYQGNVLEINDYDEMHFVLFKIYLLVSNNEY